MEAIAENQFHSTDNQIRQEKSAFIRCMLLKYKCVIIFLLAALNFVQYFHQPIIAVQQFPSKDVTDEILVLLKQIYSYQQQQCTNCSIITCL